MLNYQKKTLSNCFANRLQLAPCTWVFWRKDRKESGRTRHYKELLCPQPFYPHTKLISWSDSAVTQPNPPNCPLQITPKRISQLKFAKRDLWGLSIHKLRVAVALLTHVKEKLWNLNTWFWHLWLFFILISKQKNNCLFENRLRS